jgi:UDP-perosamine 4-acetyltransferase
VTRAVLIGVGGHARTVLDAARGAGVLDVVGATDRTTGAGRSLDGLPVLGDDGILTALLADGVRTALIGVGGVGDNRPRQRVFEHVRGLGFHLPAVVHPSATVSRVALLGPGTVVLAGAVVGPGAVVGVDVIVNSGAVVEHDCRIADHVHVATGALLGGGAVVEHGAHVGIGACLLQGRTVGAGAVIGAGAVVTRDIPAGVVATGVPAAGQTGNP